jgi:hypothetical protein
MFIDWLCDRAKEAWNALKNLTVKTGRFLLECAKAVANAVGLTALPLEAIRHDASLASACKATVPHAVSQATIVKTGAVTKAAVAKVGAGAAKIGMAKLATWCASLAPVAPAAVGTAVIGTGLCIAFVGFVWLAKRAIKKFGDLIEVLAAVEDTETTAVGLALVA